MAGPLIRRGALFVGALVVLLVLLALAYGARVAWAAHNGVAGTDGTRTGIPVDAPVTIARDERDVPHIRAGSVHDLMVADGYAMGSDRLFQMDLSRRYVDGRLAELLGAPVVRTDRRAEQFGQAAVDVAPAEVHLEEPVGAHRVAVGDHQIVDRAGPDVRHVPLVARDRDRRVDRDPRPRPVGPGDPVMRSPSDPRAVGQRQQHEQRNQGTDEKRTAADQRTGHRPLATALSFGGLSDIIPAYALRPITRTQGTSRPASPGVSFCWNDQPCQPVLQAVPSNENPSHPVLLTSPRPPLSVRRAEQRNR